MKRIFTFFFALLSACTFSAYADIVEGTCGDNLTWTLNTKDSTLVISGEGNMANYDYYLSPLSPWYTYKSYIKYVTLEDGVTSIGECAFRYCSGLTSVTISNSVTSIGDYAFRGCRSLTSITIPNSVTSIGECAFFDCTGLTSINIPNSVTSIGNYAFDGCSSLTSIVVEESNTMYDSRENCNAIIETASNTLITGCKNTTIPNSVTTIGGLAFESCSGLTSITIPNSVTSIGYAAFSSCSGLTSVTIGSGVTSIVYGAFRYCSGLTSVTFGSGVTSIGEYAFEGCNIREVTAYMPTPPAAASCGINPAAATLYVSAEYIDTYSNTLWWEDFKEIRAITTAAAPEVFVNPADPAQKLIRNGQVYILHEEKMYTISGQVVK